MDFGKRSRTISHRTLLRKCYDYLKLLKLLFKNFGSSSITRSVRHEFKQGLTQEVYLGPCQTSTMEQTQQLADELFDCI